MENKMEPGLSQHHLSENLTKEFTTPAFFFLLSQKGFLFDIHCWKLKSTNLLRIPEDGPRKTSKELPCPHLHFSRGFFFSSAGSTLTLSSIISPAVWSQGLSAPQTLFDRTQSSFQPSSYAQKDTEFSIRVTSDIYHPWLIEARGQEMAPLPLKPTIRKPTAQV